MGFITSLKAAVAFIGTYNLSYQSSSSEGEDYDKAISEYGNWSWRASIAIAF